MFDFLSTLHFGYPAFLAAFLAVPLLWWLLRVMPPRARRIYLPTSFLLRGIDPQDRTAAKTPWWLILLRMLLLSSIILAFADPVLGERYSFSGNGGSVVIAVDNGWSAASHWQERLKGIEKIATAAAVNGRSVILLPTSIPLGMETPESQGPFVLDQAIAEIRRMKPTAWLPDYAAVAKKMEDVRAVNEVSHAVFVSDGTEQADFLAFANELAKGNPLTVVTDGKINRPVLLRRKLDEKDELSFTAQRLMTMDAEDIQLQALSTDGVLLDQKTFSFGKGEAEAVLHFDMPDNIAKQVSAVRILSPESAGGTYLLSRAETSIPAGIIADAGRETDKSFLNDVYYLRRALENEHDLSFGNTGELIDKKLSVMIWPDSASLSDTDRKSLNEWVDNGGLLIRFAGPNLSAKSSEDDLLPVNIRAGERVMQGSLTGDQPLGLQKAGSDSPFADMPVPADVKVTHQLLAVPTPDVFEKTWLSLEDGSPLVTGAKKGKGMIVLVHTSAGPAWSDFCYSGYYVEMMHRLIARGQSIGNFKPQGGDLRAISVLDGFGRTYPAEMDLQLKTVKSQSEFYPSSQLPPGLYGRDGNVVAMNLGEALLSMKPLERIPAQATQISFDENNAQSFRIPLLKMAIVLLVIDHLVMIVLSGALRRRYATVVLFSLLLLPGQAKAEAIDQADLSSGIYLAYIETGDQRVDQLSYNGLNGLKEVLNARTMAKISGITGVDPSHDDLSYYPVIYWPMTPVQSNLSLSATRALQSYLQEGGLLVIDTRDGNFGTGIAESSGSASLKRLTADLAIPALMPIGEGHILTRSFYLLNQFPGANDAGQVWVEKSPSASNDSVTALIIGGHEWAAAWSMEDSDRQRFPVSPGGDGQREMAYRFGVNMVMAALTGNYKLDQIHSAEILKKLQQ